MPLTGGSVPLSMKHACMAFDCASQAVRESHGSAMMHW
jgi:hypothetical protein